jgi:hypothetical protein
MPKPNLKLRPKRQFLIFWPSERDNSATGGELKCKTMRHQEKSFCMEVNECRNLSTKNVMA